MSSELTDADWRASDDSVFAAVLERARRGSGAALRHIYETLSPEVAGYVRVRGATDVAAATNEVFHRAFSRLDRFRGGEAGFRSWVFTIARNLLIDEHRRRVRRPRVVASLDPLHHDMTGGNVEDEAMAILNADDIGGLLATLTPGQQEVLHLRMIAGLTLAETAEVLGRPVGAVKSLQHRAVETLRAKLSESPYPARPQARSQG